MKDLQTLRELNDLKYRGQQKELAKLLEEEAIIRAGLQQLRDKAAHSSLPAYEPLNAQGADVMWRGWLAQTKAEMNTKLARVLAEKERQRRLVKKAYGRVLATEGLEHQISTSKKRVKSERSRQNLLEFVSVQKLRSSDE